MIRNFLPQKIQKGAKEPAEHFNFMFSFRPNETTIYFSLKGRLRDTI